MRDLTGLSSLATLEPIEIDHAASLESLDGLGPIASLPGALTIRGNAALTNLDALSSLRGVGWEIAIASNPALASVERLDGVETVGDRFGLTIVDNAMLRTIDLASLRAVTGQIEISANPSVVAIRLRGLTAASTITVAGHEVASTMLSTCEAEVLRDRWVAAGFAGTVTIEGNLPCP